jgi:hypothetical protein
MPELPPPLPPEERTVAQFIGETIRAYGDHFWRLLPIGLAFAIVDQVIAKRTAPYQALVFWASAPLIAAAFVWACAVVHHKRPTINVFLVALLIYLPFPALRAFFILPGIAWFAFIGLAVPAMLVEGLRFRDALVRGRQLGTADFAYALGSLAVLVLVVGLGEYSMSVVLRSQSDNSRRAALFLGDLILSPMLYIGGALLYLDQAARVGTSRSDRKRRRA